MSTVAVRAGSSWPAAKMQAFRPSLLLGAEVHAPSSRKVPLLVALDEDAILMDDVSVIPLDLPPERQHILGPSFQNLPDLPQSRIVRQNAGHMIPLINVPRSGHNLLHGMQGRILLSIHLRHVIDAKDLCGIPRLTKRTLAADMKPAMGLAADICQQTLAYGLARKWRHRQQRPAAARRMQCNEGGGGGRCAERGTNQGHAACPPSVAGAG
eukprot:CAMPEP_0177235582 /NCGR_PEP_ID=MMETSP0367-20130122/45001_1 /TAXON_ID=447022 ORGANISM="Scrippsiella hangoei-like, Strain SHHI-4" /NCGR_SAMPLE_ID=MMETSP0367 /ASSEMBLY_ACC=CAM_ASM_000362 /LENGTH=210 /DNA_ID=CAMNT_0018686441 /DNA_START=29 /DNA_END=663 /DNA_ORIENTATION=+